MKTKYLITTGISVLTVVLVGAGVASAAQYGKARENNPNFPPDNHEEVMRAIEDNDYDAWAELMVDKPFAEDVTQDNFDTLVQIHTLMQEGNIEEANELRKEMGIGGAPIMQRGKMMQGKMGKGACMGEPMSAEDRDAIMQALNENDYDAWYSLMEGRPITEIINQDNFSQFVEIHNLMQSGDFEAADQIREDLGLRPGPGFQHRNNPNATN